MAHLLTTYDLLPNQRLEYWTDMICSVYVQLECTSEITTNFRGEILSHTIPNLEISRVSASSQRVMRTPHLITEAVNEYIIISLQTFGNCILAQDGRYAFLQPGDFAIYDSTRPYTLHFGEDFRQFVLKIPADQMRSMIRDIDQLTARTISGKTGAGHLLITAVQSLFNQADEIATASASSIAQGIINILVGGLKSLPACTGVSLSSLEAYHIARIKKQINLRLCEPKLTIESIAREVDISVSHLHRLFHSQDESASQYLWNRRLECCSQDLLDPLQRKITVAEIAFKRGFNDAAHFSRAFKSRFGCSPREWRMRHQD